MTLQHVNMAVPVGRAMDSNASSDRTSEDNPALAALRHDLYTLLVESSKGNWREKRRHSNASRYDSEIKALIKRFSAMVSKDIPDRKLRAAVRVRLYTELWGLSRIAPEVQARSGRRERRLILLVTGFGAALLASVSTMVLLLR